VNEDTRVYSSEDDKPGLWYISIQLADEQNYIIYGPHTNIYDSHTQTRLHTWHSFQGEKILFKQADIVMIILGN
jgi:hypothetical protein